MKKIIYGLIICSLTSFGQIYGQESHGGKPMTFSVSETVNTFRKIKGVSQINTNQLPTLDNTSEAMEAEKVSLAMGQQKSMLYGKSIDIDIDLKKTANVQLMGDSGKLYLYQICSPTAYALQVCFDAFKLPKGARMFMYDKEKTMFLGSFTSQNNFVTNKFATQFIPGNTVVIEYYEPNQVEFESQIHISGITHVFTDLKMGIYSAFETASCSLNKNASCQEGYGWERERKSVALVLMQVNKIVIEQYSGYTPKSDYWGYGSGALINDVQQDGIPYFLTANHLLSPKPTDYWQLKPLENPVNWIFLFNHDAPTCAGDGSTAPSNINVQDKGIFGAFVKSHDLAGFPTSDYLLLQLDATPSTIQSYGAVYAGWDINETNALLSKGTTCIHHPGGDAKKISIDSDSPVSDNPDGYSTFGDLYFWKVGWDIGITQPGSSGAPLFNSNHKIIGQLYGGGSSCDNRWGNDYFGKFSKSYELGGFRTYLDRDFTYSKTVGSYNPSKSGEHCYNGTECGGDCPPCAWVTSSAGWGGNPLSYNKVKDEAQGEVGVDCGGPYCKPCGGDAQCSNGIKDGDETDVDCGGSCQPCEIYCKGQVIYNGFGLTPGTIVIVTDFSSPAMSQVSNTDSSPSHISSSDIINPTNSPFLPAYTSVSNFIEASNSIVRSDQTVTFKSAGKITLKTGFSAKEGSTFKAKYETCAKCQKMYVSDLPDGMTNELRITQSGADRYDITVVNYWGIKTYSSSGYIYDKNPCLWNSSKPAGIYAVEVNLYNDCSGEKKRLSKVVVKIDSFIKISAASPNDIIDDENPINSDNLAIYPNPTRGKISVKNYSDVPIRTINVYNASGQLLIHKECDQNQYLTDIDLNRYANGLYLIKVQTTNNSYTKSIILQK